MHLLYCMEEPAIQYRCFTLFELDIRNAIAKVMAVLDTIYGMLQKSIPIISINE